MHLKDKMKFNQVVFLKVSQLETCIRVNLFVFTVSCNLHAGQGIGEINGGLEKTVLAVEHRIDGMVCNQNFQFFLPKEYSLIWQGIQPSYRRSGPRKKLKVWLWGRLFLSSQSQRCFLK